MYPCACPGVTSTHKRNAYLIRTSTSIDVADRLIHSGKVPQVPIHQSSSRLGLADVDQVVLERIVQIIGDNRLALQQAALDPAHLAAALFVDQEPRAELLRLDLEEPGQLLEVHGGVEFQVRADGRVEQGVLDLVHEDGGLVVDRVDVERRVVEVRRRRADELGAGGSEELLKQRNGLGAAVLETVELLAVLLAETRVDGIIETGGVESDADGDQSVHLVILLGNGIEAVAALLEVLRSGDVYQNVAEHADGVGVATHHHVREAHVVVCGEMGGHDAGKHGLLVHLDVIERLQSQTKVSQQAVDTQEPDD